VVVTGLEFLKEFDCANVYLFKCTNFDCFVCFMFVCTSVYLFGLFEVVTGSLSPFYSLSLFAYNIFFVFFYLISISLFWHVNKGACACVLVLVGE